MGTAPFAVAGHAAAEVDQATRTPTRIRHSIHQPKQPDASGRLAHERGKVKDFIYIGTVIKTAVELKDDQEIKQSRFELDGTLREGADVYAWWEPHHGVAIHDASEAEVQT